MEKKIVIKEIDKLASALHKDRIVTEYLIYLIINENHIQPLEAYTEFGEDAKKIRVNELILLHFINEDIIQHPIIEADIIEEISFEEYSKELKKILKK
jgi:hypothetical protein